MEVYPYLSWLVGTGTWLLFFQKQLGMYGNVIVTNNHPNWRTQNFQRGRLPPPTVGLFWGCWMILEGWKMNLEIWDDVGSFEWLVLWTMCFIFPCIVGIFVLPTDSFDIYDIYTHIYIYNIPYITYIYICYIISIFSRGLGQPPTRSGWKTRLISCLPRLPRPNRFTEISFRKIRTLEKAARRAGSSAGRPKNVGHGLSRWPLKQWNP